MRTQVTSPAPKKKPTPKPPKVQRALYDIEESAELLSISRSYLFELIKNGEISIVKLGRRTLLPPEEISRLIASHLKTAL